jgi:pimeloyl-ACP methyl ester carboxylesterase
MDGVLPAEESLGSQIALHSQAAFDALVAQCEADTSCREAYPNLAAGVTALFERLEASSVEARYRKTSNANLVEETVTRGHLVSVVRMALYNSELLSVLPSILAKAYRDDDFSALARMAQRLDISEQLAMGMHNSVVCSEDIPFIDAVPGETLEATYMGSQMVEALRGLCAVWPRGEVDASIKQPLRSSIPSLLLSGERDPITPPAYGEQVLEGLENGRHIVVPHRGHHVGTISCVPRVIAQFVDLAQSESLQTECLGRLNPVPLFLDVNGPSP